MPDRITLTEAGLRDAIRDPRYWTSGHPEREAYTAWVSDGYRAMYNSGEAKGGTVKVRAYTRTRDGKTEHVDAHSRAAPPGRSLEAPAMLGPAIRGAQKVAPMIPPVIGGIIQSLPRPNIRDWSSLFPDRPRPSLLDPSRETDGRRRGTVNGARPFEVPEEEPSPGTMGGVMQNAPPEDGEGDDDGGAGTGGGATTIPDRPDGERPRLSVNGHQAKHTWPPDREFVPGRDFMPDGRSAIRPEENPQSLADDFAGTGERIGSKEYVDTGRVIGTYRNDKTGEVASTTRITIHH